MVNKLPITKLLTRLLPLYPEAPYMLAGNIDSSPLNQNG